MKFAFEAEWISQNIGKNLIATKNELGCANNCLDDIHVVIAGFIMAQTKAICRNIVVRR